MQLKLPYGNHHVAAELPEGRTVYYVMPMNHPPADDPAVLLRQAVYNPLGDVLPPRAGQSVAIAINDKTRRVSIRCLFPALRMILRARCCIRSRTCRRRLTARWSYCRTMRGLASCRPRMRRWRCYRLEDQISG
ncbi:MAG: DUF2088 domain-containing protein [Chloroflexi bacterium]|nr:DUF2088 domain-containing protein [Chloroflexota bacterium]